MIIKKCKMKWVQVIMDRPEWHKSTAFYIPKIVCLRLGVFRLLIFSEGLRIYNNHAL